MGRLVVLLSAAALVVCAAQPGLARKGGRKVEIKIKSSAFEEGGMIPAKYTCDGANVSPPLQWNSVPKGAKSLALVCDDPDAPGGTWVHWVVFNIPHDTDGLAEGQPPAKKLPDGASQGANDFRKIGYGGPCPPSGVHRYYFRLFALDSAIGLEPGITRAQLVKAMEGHILARGELMGRYKRK